MFNLFSNKNHISIYTKDSVYLARRLQAFYATARQTIIKTVFAAIYSIIYNSWKW